MGQTRAEEGWSPEPLCGLDVRDWESVPKGPDRHPCVWPAASHARSG